MDLAPASLVVLTSKPSATVSAMSVQCRYRCKSHFASGFKNSTRRGRDFRVKMRGTSSPRVKLTGDFANATGAIRIGDCFLVHVFAKNSWPCNFRLLQHYRRDSGHRLRPSSSGWAQMPSQQWAIPDPPQSLQGSSISDSGSACNDLFNFPKP